ncbi:hypothetical protein [Pseudoalteromonas phage J2-1_QLiu-2017]|nr:hypothetical protein [Pseudoalteromonas phage J2-1_QLiu-2017]
MKVNAQESAKILNGKFCKSGQMSKQSLNVFRDTRFFSKDAETNEDVYSVTRRTARWLLNSLKHPDLSEDQVKRVLSLKTHIEHRGMKGVWSTEPVVIDADKAQIEDGLVRLYAIAICNKQNNIPVPIKIKNIGESDGAEF